MPISKQTQKWIAIALQDHRDAKALLDFGDRFLRLVVFSSQQASEKIIKAFLNEHRLRIPKTHDIEDLLILVEGQNPNLSKKLQIGIKLSEYAVGFRYPDGPAESVSISAAKSAFEISEIIINAILLELGVSKDI